MGTSSPPVCSARLLPPVTSTVGPLAPDGVVAALVQLSPSVWPKKTSR